MTYVALVVVSVCGVLLALLGLVRTVRRQRQLKQETRSYYASMKDLNTPKDRERYRW